MIYTDWTKKAMKLAYEAHHGQVDKGGMPYVFHPFHLAEQMDDEISTVAALLHDVGKPACFAQDETGRGHFKGHAQVGAAMAAEILRELDAPKPLAAEVVWLIDHHMEPLPRNEAELSADVERDGLTRTRQLLILKEADARSKGVAEGQKDTLPRIYALQALLENWR